MGGSKIAVLGRTYFMDGPLNVRGYAVYSVMQLHHKFRKVDSVVVNTLLVILKRISIESKVRILLSLAMQCFTLCNATSA